jgi:hypothetical protein
MGIFTRETAETELAEPEIQAGPAAEPEAEAEMEGEIREFVRREVDVGPRRQENDGTLIADNISSLLQRVSASSVQEIDALISDLKILRERLHDDGRRVQRQIVQYASLSQAAMQSTKVIAESLGHWKNRPPGSSGMGDGN